MQRASRNARDSIVGEGRLMQLKVKMAGLGFYNLLVIRFI